MLLQAIRLSFGGKSTIIHVAWQVLRVNESRGGLTMKVVAGSCGNDAIGPLAMIGGGMMVCPHEWGPRADRSAHIDCEFLASPVGAASSKVLSRNGVPFGALLHNSFVVDGSRLAMLVARPVARFARGFSYGFIRGSASRPPGRNTPRDCTKPRWSGGRLVFLE